MIQTTRRLRLFAALAGALLAGALLAGPILPALAQDGPGGPLVTPPPRVGRMAWTRGTVSFRPNGASEWDRAATNYPVSAGDAVWTQPGASAGVQLGATSIDLAAGTELDIDRLDPTGVAATVAQGEVVLRIDRLLPGETYTLQTPRGTATLTAPGSYEIAAGSTESPTLVTVFRGAATLSGPANLELRGGQTAMVTGTQTFEARVTPAMHDAFATAMLRPRPVRRYAVAPPPLVAEMPGGEDLGDYGQWAPNSAYGPIWYPRVASGWVPYRDGHWAYVAPWGWTWIDDDRWGFAPFHYGRWVEIGPRWAWVPGQVVVAEAPAYPVYAPALVAFFGVGGGIAASLSFGALVGGSVGWVPLAPFEAYHPCFRASPAYVREVNIRQVTNVTNITNVTVNQVTINRFRNQRGVTVVPAAALVSSRPIAPLARPGGARILATSSRPVLGRPPVAPAASTAGVTASLARRQGIAPLAPAVARQLPRNLAPLARPAAPGPALRPVATGQFSRPGVVAGARSAPGLPGGPRPVTGPTGAQLPLARTPAPAPVRPPLAHPGAAPMLAPHPGLPATRPVAPTPGARIPGRAIQGGPAPLPTLRAPGGAHPSSFPAHPSAPGALPPPRVITPGAGPAPRPATPAYRPAPAPARPPLASPATPAYRPAPAPAYHPPASAYRASPPTPAYHPPAPAYRPPAPVYHPPAPAYHPPAPAYRPPAPAYHPPAPAYRPPAPAYHRPAPAYRPPPPAYHPPAPAYHPPPPRPAPPPQRQQDQHHP